MDRLALSQGQKTAEKPVRCSIKRTFESIDRLAIIEGQKNFERTVRISSKETIKSMNRLAIIQNERLNLWIDWLQSRAKELWKQRLDY